MSIKIVMVDDHPLVRDGMRFAIKQQKDMIVLGEADNGPDAVKLAANLRPDLVIMDLKLGDANGIDVAREILEISPSANIVVLTAYPDTNSVNEAIKIGVRGYVLKSNAPLEILQAIRTVMAGQFYLTTEITGMVIENYRKLLSSSNGLPKPELTERELSVLQLLAEGFRIKEIASRLNISTKTVETHRANLLKKLQCDNTVALVRYAIQNKISPLQNPDDLT